MGETVMNKENIGVALGRIPSGVFIVTTTDGTERVGMMASWVQQVGFEPPTISIAVHPERELYAVLKRSKTLTVNVISNQNNSLMKSFSRYSPEQFDGVNHQEDGYGITLNEAVAALQCNVIQIVEGVSDHCLVIAQVVNGQSLSSTLEPMVHLRKSGFNY